MTIKKAYVDTLLGQIHFRYGGPTDAIPIIFLHQNTSSSKMFERTMDKLCNIHHVIAFDLPGFGESYDPPDFDSISQLTLPIIEAINALEIDEFHLCGQHTGAGMAAEIGVLLPERVRSVMMIGPPLLTNEEKQWYRDNFKGSAKPDKDAQYLRATWEYLETNGAGVNLEMFHDEFWQSLRSWRARGMVYGCVWDYPFEGFFELLKCPMLLMSAPDDVLYQGYLRAKEARPAACAVELRGSNFEAYLDPNGTSNAISNFLNKTIQQIK
jgi:pimeloyl-ACP methyl ester carboxylesterase